jgi:predicted RNA-binding Zn-ribbon protein involved in translation (DUF1610 family)
MTESRREPVRYVSRYDSEMEGAARSACPVCAAPLPSPRACYCSEACKQRAYRRRQAAATAPDLTAQARELKRLQVLVAHTVYECPTCGERYLGVQRCPDCQHFCRALGLGGACPNCDQVLLSSELLE